MLPAVSLFAKNQLLDKREVEKSSTSAMSFERSIFPDVSNKFNPPNADLGPLYCLTEDNPGRLKG